MTAFFNLVLIDMFVSLIEDNETVFWGGAVLGIEPTAFTLNYIVNSILFIYFYFAMVFH